MTEALAHHTILIGGDDISARKIARVYKKVSLESQESDFAFWQSQPYAVRLATLEQIRREFHQWRGDAQPGLQRVYRIIKR